MAKEETVQTPAEPKKKKRPTVFQLNWRRCKLCPGAFQILMERSPGVETLQRKHTWKRMACRISKECHYFMEQGLVYNLPALPTRYPSYACHTFSQEEITKIGFFFFISIGSIVFFLNSLKVNQGD